MPDAFLTPRGGNAVLLGTEVPGLWLPRMCSQTCRYGWMTSSGHGLDSVRRPLWKEPPRVEAPADQHDEGTGCSCFRGSGRPAMTICPYHVVKIREHVKKDLGKTSLFIASPSLRAMMMPETPRRSH